MKIAVLILVRMGETHAAHQRSWPAHYSSCLVIKHLKQTLKKSRYRQNGRLIFIRKLNPSTALHHISVLLSVTAIFPRTPVRLIMLMTT